MRRFVAGFVWFLVLYFGIIGAGGAILASINGFGWWMLNALSMTKPAI